MPFLSMSVAGDEKLKLGLQSMIARIRDMRPLARPFDWRFRMAMGQAFKREGSPKGAWAALSEYTLRTRRYPGMPILVQTGALKRSLTQANNSEHILDAHRDYVEIGSRVPYAVYHQTGTRKMPAREMLVLDRHIVSRMIEDMRHYIMDNTIFSGI